MNLFSRYSWKYPGTLIYMLQSSEYNLREYFGWLHRTGNFGKVQKRKRLVYTHKAVALLAIAWLLYGLGWVLAFKLYGLVGLTVAFIALPIVLPYLLVAPLAIGVWVVQKPREAMINEQTRKYLRSHSGLRIGIAGSYGKTTFKESLAAVLSTSKKVATTPGNYNTPIGINRFIKTLTGDEEVLIFEMGEYYEGDIKKLSDLVDPQMGAITGINEAHLEKFKTVERTQDTIYELSDHLKDKNVYVNGESKLAAQKVRSGNITYSMHGCGGWEVKSDSIKTGLNGTEFEINKGKRRLKLHTQLLGVHQVGPISAMVAIADSLGLSDTEIEKGVAAIKPFEHRMQPKPQPGNVTWIDDTYNGNPDGALAAMEFLASLKSKRRIYVTPGLVEMGDKSREVHFNIGKKLAGSADVVILIRNSVAHDIEQGLLSAHFKGELRWYEDGPAAIKALPALTKAGDVVLLQNDWGDNYA